MNLVPPTAHGIATAVEALRSGGVVAYPTETVYGFAVDPHSPEAMRKLFQVKGRPDTNPVLLIIADESQLSQVALAPGDHARWCMQQFWPGPLSLVLDAVPGLHPALAPDAKVCVRCPGLDIARQLCRAIGGPVTSTSANLSGHPPARNAHDAALPGVDIVIDGGTLADSPPSTVYDPAKRIVLRAGAIAPEALVEMQH